METLIGNDCKNLQDTALPTCRNFTAYPFEEDFFVHFFETYKETLIEEMRRIKAISINRVIDPSD